MCARCDHVANGYGVSYWLCVCRRMRTGWVTPSVAVVVGVAVTFGSVAGSEIWGFCEGDLVVVSVDWGLGSSFETCASFVESIVECVNFV